MKLKDKSKLKPDDNTKPLSPGLRCHHHSWKTSHVSSSLDTSVSEEVTCNNFVVAMGGRSEALKVEP